MKKEIEEVEIDDKDESPRVEEDEVGKEIKQETKQKGTVTFDGIDPALLADLQVNGNGDFIVSGKVLSLSTNDWGDLKGKGNVRIQLDNVSLQGKAPQENMIERINKTEDIEELDKIGKELENE